LDSPHPYELYLRACPWTERAVELQVGMVPLAFGAFSQGYGPDAALVAYPLVYHYPTLLRADAAPRGVEDLLRLRGRGALFQYPLGAKEADRGLPVIAALHSDTGVQLRLGREAWQMSAALTQGSLSNPLFRDDNRSK